MLLCPKVACALCSVLAFSGCSLPPDPIAPDGSSTMDSGGGGSDGTEDGGSDGTDGGNSGMRIIPPDVLSRKALAYSGYRAGQSPETGVYPSEAQIKEDLQLLIRGGWTFLRLFDCSPHLTRVIKVIQDNSFDIKLLAGVNLFGPKAQHDAENRAEIERCVPIFTGAPDVIVAVSVGNETLDDWSNIRMPIPDVLAYIQEVRSRIPQPVTTNDMAPPFTFGMDGNTSYADVVQIVAVLDFLNIHVYPFLDAPYDSWDWKQTSVPAGHARAVAMMRAAFEYTRSSIEDVRQATASRGFHLPILLGETGWKSRRAGSDPTERFMAHPVNEKMYYDAIQSWVYGANRTEESPLAAFYFEGFDEPWKAEDDGWGLFDTNRKAQYVLWAQFPDLKPPGAPNYTENDAVYYH